MVSAPSPARQILANFVLELFDLVVHDLELLPSSPESHLTWLLYERTVAWVLLLLQKPLLGSSSAGLQSPSPD
jgi:hypothetical protein